MLVGRALVGFAMVAAVGAAGCLAEPEEAGCLERAYVSIHWEQRLDRETLREALESRGYRWEPRENDNARLTPPGETMRGIRGIVAPQPGLSGEGTIISIEDAAGDSPGSSAMVRAVAQDVAGVVNSTFDSPPIAQWIEGDRSNCPPDVGANRVRLAARPLG